jgi:hypothetical protein
MPNTATNICYLLEERAPRPHRSEQTEANRIWKGLVTGDPENAGGEGVLVGLHRCQVFKVALRKHLDQDGNSYNRGDVIAADSNVTGTDRVRLQNRNSL